jgi:hypothetical protein
LAQEAVGADDDEDLEEDLDTIGEEEEEDPSEVSDGDGSVAPSDIKEAFAAGWQAKKQVSAKKKARGWSKPTTSRTSSSASSLAEKKRISTCASCGGKGHWRGDPQCPHVQSGRDAPHTKGQGGSPKKGTWATASSTTSSSALTSEVNFTNFTFMVGGAWDVICAGCSAHVPPEDKYCGKCGT